MIYDTYNTDDCCVYVYFCCGVYCDMQKQFDVVVIVIVIVVVVVVVVVIVIKRKLKEW